MTVVFGGSSRCLGACVRGASQCPAVVLTYTTDLAIGGIVVYVHRVVVTYWYRRRQARRHRNSRSEAAGTDRVERRGRSRRGIATTARRRQRPSTATHTTSLCTPPARCTHAQATCCIAAATYRIQLETLQRWYGKCPPKCHFLGGGGSSSRLIHGSLCTPESTPQPTFRSVLPF